MLRSIQEVCIKEYQPETWEAISIYMEELITEDELKLIQAFRHGIGAPYISALDKDQRNKLDCFMHSMSKETSTIQ